jgi:hypothetical protein
MAVTATKILDAKVAAEQAWADSQAIKSRRYMPPMKTVGTILSQQTARLDALKDRRNCGTMKVGWKALCQGTPSITTGITKINTFLCNITGTGSNTAVATYTMDTEITSSGFTIEDDDCENMYTTEQLLTDGLLLQHKEIVEKLNDFVMSKLVTFAGDNLYLGNGLVTDAGGDLFKVSAYDANAATLVPYLSRAADINKMSDPFLFTGDALYNNKYIDQHQAGTPADKGYWKMWGEVATVEDFLTFNNLNMPNDFFYVDAGSVAIVTKYTGTLVPQEKDYGFWVSTQPLLGGILRDNAGEPIYVDVYHKRGKVVKETVNGQDRCVMADTFKLALKVNVFLNPLACNNDYTGVIHFQKDATIPPFGVPAQFAKLPDESMGAYQAI